MHLPRPVELERGDALSAAAALLLPAEDPDTATVGTGGADGAAGDVVAGRWVALPAKDD